MTTTTTATTHYHPLIVLLYHHGLDVVAAMFIILVGVLIAKFFRQLTDRIMARRGIEPTIRLFVNQLLYSAFLISVFIAALAKVGISIASLVAILGAAALAISLSLKDALSNLASGVLLLLFQPFKVNDELTFSGQQGRVKEVNLLFTTIEDDNQQQTLIPNSKLTANLTQNVRHQPFRDLHCIITFNRQAAEAVEPQLLPLLSQLEIIENRHSLNVMMTKLAIDTITLQITLRVPYHKQHEAKQQILQSLYAHYKTVPFEVAIR